jgi:hypothetical protein
VQQIKSCKTIYTLLSTIEPHTNRANMADTAKDAAAAPADSTTAASSSTAQIEEATAKLVLDEGEFRATSLSNTR